MTENIKEKLELVVEDEDAEPAQLHPCCPHGPTLLFYRQTPNDGYFACSAHRDRKLCNFRMEKSDWNYKHRQPLQVGKYLNAVTSDKVYIDPTRELEALSQDQVHAQYFFDDKTLEFFEDQFTALKIDKVVCMGTPRLHFHLRRTGNKKSFLLDFDERFAEHLNPQEFCLYNMCNNHFFYKRQPFEMFLKCKSQERLLIVTDPPFGCRTELIAHTLRSLRRLHNDLNELPVNTPLSIFWVYPYYMGNYIRKDMPELAACDYKLNYTNHERYTNVGPSSRSYGSPVRVFTNVPLELLQLREEHGYKFCDKCQRYTALENTHCERCNNCSSLNGQTYKHCTSCDICVKPNYVHCTKCRRCSQREGHNCELYQSKQHCWLCGQLGHIETNCQVWRMMQRWQRKRKQFQQQGCLICGQSKHNERKCLQRYKYFKESHFMGHTVIMPRHL